MGRGARLAAALAALAFGAIFVVLGGGLAGVFGAGLTCSGGSGGALGGAPPTRSAKQEIDPVRLRLFREAGKRFNVNWAFLASIGIQECASGTCAGDSGSGCGGPMQIAFVRGTPCSPDPSAPTLWERYGMDADGDGEADVNDLADAIFSAAKMLRPVFGLSGDSYDDYQEVACNYYGACTDSIVSYAAEVMARAVRFGFNGAGSPAPSESGGAQVAGGGGCGGGAALPTGTGPMGPVHRATAPRHLATLPTSISSAPGIECDARIVPDVVYLARRFGIIVTACYSGSGHEATGEHPLGAAIDAAPRDGNWNRTMRLARALGWRGPSGEASPPFRWIGYNGALNHGDPLHCTPCTGGPHIHLSWLTSASEGQPEWRPRYSYEPASWIEVFGVEGEGVEGEAGRK